MTPPQRAIRTGEREPPMRPRKGFHWAWIILACGFFNLFINYSVRLGYGVILPEMIRDLHLSRTAGGTIFNAYLFVYVAVAPLTGYLTDRLGARRVIAVCALILGGGVTLMGTSASLASAAAFFGLAGLGATGMWTPVITVVQRWFRPDRRGLALGLLSTGYGLGFAAVGAAFPWLVANLSWRYAWFFLGWGALFMVAANALLLRDDPSSIQARPWGGPGPERFGTEPAAPRKRAAALWVLREGRFWLVGCSYFCMAYGLYGLTTFMVDYARYQLGAPPERASLLATVHGIGQVAGVLIILPLSDRLGRKRTLLLSNSVITASLLGVLLTSGSLTALFILVGVVAVFYGVTFPLYGACAGDYFPREAMGTVIGAWTPFYGAGAILVHWVSGLLVDRLGSYEVPFVINVLLAGLGLALISRLGGPPAAGE